jgi:signal recognition particle receptor subunit beta
MDANLETIDNLVDNLKEHGFDFASIPYVLQLNKRDLPNAMTVDALKSELLQKSEPVIEACAIDGTGIFDTLKEVAKLVLAELKKGT